MKAFPEKNRPYRLLTSPTVKALQHTVRSANDGNGKRHSPDSSADVVLVDELRAREMVRHPAYARDGDQQDLQQHGMGEQSVQHGVSAYYFFAPPGRLVAHAQEQRVHGDRQECCACNEDPAVSIRHH